MLRKSCLLLASLYVAVSASFASWAGFQIGAHEVQSQVGQPLRIEIALLPDPGQPPAIPCVRILGDAYGSRSGARTADFKFVPADSGQPARIYLTGAEPVFARAVSLTLETGCVETSRINLDLLIPPETYAVDRAPTEARQQPVAIPKAKRRGKPGKTK